MTNKTYRYTPREQDRLRAVYLWACSTELDTLKPGNVSMRSAGHGMHASDFLESAKASVEPMISRGPSLGERIYRAVRATHTVVGCNTNLGIVLLCAPLIHAFLRTRSGESLRGKLHEILRDSDVNDAAWAYRAIRLASPGGLGHSTTQDVRTEPTVSLQEAMRLAAHRDRIAFQYVSGFADVFDFALPRLRTLQSRVGHDFCAITGLFLGLLARYQDSHIKRKFGSDKAREISAKAAQLESDYLRASIPDRMHQRLRQVDEEFKSAGINPGTTADLTVATLLVYQLEGLLSSDERDLSIIQQRERNARMPCPRIYK